jgi:SWIM zinc finger
MPPRGEIRVIWTLSKIQEDPMAPPAAYAVADDGRETHCTCPDHQINGATCKHIMALRALTLLPRPQAQAAPAKAPAPPVPQPTARIEEGWEPGGRAEAPAPSPADGFREAVRREIRRKRGESGPCRSCGVEISPAESYEPGGFLCGDCFEKGGAL